MSVRCSCWRSERTAAGQTVHWWQTAEVYWSQGFLLTVYIYKYLLMMLMMIHDSWIISTITRNLHVNNETGKLKDRLWTMINQCMWSKFKIHAAGRTTPHNRPLCRLCIMISRWVALSQDSYPLNGTSPGMNAEVSFIKSLTPILLPMAVPAVCEWLASSWWAACVVAPVKCKSALSG